MRWTLRPKPKLEPLISTVKNMCPFAPLLPKWVTLSPLPRCKLTITPPRASPTRPQKKSAPKQLTCVFIGSKTASARIVLIYWQPGSTNLGDYHTKHHLPAHHRLMHRTYLHPTNQLDNHVISLLLQGCVKSSPQSRTIHVTRQLGLISQK